MADIGAPSVTFVLTEYTATDCLQSATFTINGQNAEYYCGGTTKLIGGPQEIRLGATFAIAKTDVTLLNATKPGSTGAGAYAPGDSTISYSALNATSISATLTSAPNAAMTWEVQWAWDDLV
jgi:hypothetical protein